MTATSKKEVTVMGAKEAVQHTPEALIAAAIEKGVDASMITALMEMRNSLKAEAAREAYYDAMAAFQAEMPIIPKTRVIKDGRGAVRSRYASLDDIRQAIAKPLAQNNLSYRFEIAPGEAGTSVTCIVTHSMGHSERTTLMIPIDAAMSASAAQKVGSSVTYGQRYTLIGALGITSADQDTDGAVINYITDKEVVSVMRLIDESKANYEQFLTTFEVDRVADMRAENLGTAIKALNRKIEQAKKEEKSG